MMKRCFNYNRFLGWYSKKKKGTGLAILLGLFALIWFLVRVIPKPQRAFYPCQRAAFPLATGFLIWFFGMVSSVTLFKKSKRAFKQYKLVAGLMLGLMATGIFLISMNLQGMKSIALAALMPKAESYQFSQPGTPIIEPVSLVSVVQSEKDLTSNITGNDISDMVREAVSLAGGLDNLISDGQTVVLKPNLLTSRTLPYDATQTVTLNPAGNGIITDYRIIQSMVDIIRELNPNGKIILIEGSAVGDTRANYPIIGWDRVSGLDTTIFLEEICDWQDKNSPALVRVSLPEDKVLYTRGNEHNAYYMSRVYYEADVLISLPCLKNHGAAGITGGIKNVGIGATPPPIYGWGPNDPSVPNERWNPDNGVDHGTELNRDPLHNWIHDFFLARPVDFVLMDGLQGIEMGPGAHYGSLSSCQENMRLILASHDPVAIDAIESLICGQNPARIKHLSSLHRDGAGNMDPRLIRVLGKEVHEVKKEFRIFGSGSSTTYSDFSAPKPVVRASSLSGNLLHLDITANEDIAKIEITVDGIKEAQTVVDNFYDINFSLSKTPQYMSHIVVSVYDQFLNCSKLLLGGTGTNPVFSNQFDLICYPNPAESYLTVSTRSNMNRNELLAIRDVSGRVVKIIKLEVGHDAINTDISNLNPGLYFITSQTNENMLGQFIKK